MSPNPTNPRSLARDVATPTGNMNKVSKTIGAARSAWRRFYSCSTRLVNVAPSRHRPPAVFMPLSVVLWMIIQPGSLDERKQVGLTHCPCPCYILPVTTRLRDGDEDGSASNKTRRDQVAQSIGSRPEFGSFLWFDCCSLAPASRSLSARGAILSVIHLSELRLERRRSIAREARTIQTPAPLPVAHQRRLERLRLGSWMRPLTALQMNQDQRKGRFEASPPVQMRELEEV